VLVLYIEQVLEEYEKDADKYVEYVEAFITNVETRLSSHMEFEEKEIFPLVSGHPLVEELTNEHKEIRNMLGLARDAESMQEKIEILRKLAGYIKKHIKKENTQLVPLLY